MPQDNDTDEFINNIESKKKRVTWADKSKDTKTPFLSYKTAASLSKKQIDKEVDSLIDEHGYTEEEACSIVGKPITPSGRVILLKPSFYDSKEQIDKRKKLREEKLAKQQEISLDYENQPPTSYDLSDNENSFFSFKNIGLTTALAVATTFAIFSLRK
jgi:hypothetical protein